MDFHYNFGIIMVLYGTKGIKKTRYFSWKKKLAGEEVANSSE